jgi:hypothetical protein
MIDRQRERQQAEADRTTQSLAGLAFVLFLVVLGFFLTEKLAQSTKLQDCILSGRRDCVQLEDAGI